MPVDPKVKRLRRYSRHFDGLIDVVAKEAFERHFKKDIDKAIADYIEQYSDEKFKKMFTDITEQYYKAWVEIHAEEYGKLGMRVNAIEAKQKVLEMNIVHIREFFGVKPNY